MPIDWSDYETTDAPTATLDKPDVNWSDFEPIKGPTTDEGLPRFQTPKGIVPPTAAELAKSPEQIGAEESPTPLPSMETLTSPIRSYLPQSLQPAARKIVSTLGGGAIGAVADAVSDIAPKSKVGQIAKGVSEAQTDNAEFFTSPLGIATLGIGGLPKIAQRAVSLAFSADMARQVPELAKQLGDELGKPEDERDNEKIAKLVTQGVTATGFSAGAGVHGLAPTPKAPVARMLPPDYKGPIPPVIHEPRVETIPTKGTPDASKIETPAEIHGDVQPSAVEGERQVPAEESRTGVQPPKEEGQAPRSVLLDIERVHGMTDQEASDLRHYRSKYGGGQTALSYDVGSAVKTPEELDALLKGHDRYAKELQDRRKSGNLKGIAIVALKKQFFTEAYEAATGHQVGKPGEEGSALAGIRIHEPDYQPPMAPKPNVPPTIPQATFDSVWDMGKKKMWQYTFRNLGDDPAQGMTFYVPEGTTVEAAIKRANEKLEEFKSKVRIPGSESPKKVAENLRPSVDLPTGERAVELAKLKAEREKAIESLPKPTTKKEAWLEGAPELEGQSKFDQAKQDKITDLNTKIAEVESSQDLPRAEEPTDITPSATDTARGILEIALDDRSHGDEATAAAASALWDELKSKGVDIDKKLSDQEVKFIESEIEKRADPIRKQLDEPPAAPPVPKEKETTKDKPLGRFIVSVRDREGNVVLHDFQTEDDAGLYHYQARQGGAKAIGRARLRKGETRESVLSKSEKQFGEGKVKWFSPTEAIRKITTPEPPPAEPPPPESKVPETLPVKAPFKMTFKQFLDAPREEGKGGILEALRTLPKDEPTPEQKAASDRYDAASAAAEKAGLGWIYGDHPQVQAAIKNLSKAKKKIVAEYESALNEKVKLSQQGQEARQRSLYDKAVKAGIIENPESGIGAFIKSGFEEAKADKEKERGTSGDVAMRLSPDLGIEPFVKKDVAPFLKKGVDAGKAIVDIMVDVFSPASKTSSRDVDELFSAKGYKEKVMTRATDALDASKAKFDAMPQAEQIAFVDRVKRGQRQPTPELQQTADLMRKWDNRLYVMAKRYRPDLPYLENHNRVLWKVIPGSPQARGASIGGTLSKRPWQGGKGFLRRHVLDDMSEGLALGGVPVTYNPVEMFLLHAQDVMKFVSANRAWEGLKKTGSVEWVRTGRKPPDGYVRISDNIARPYFRTPTGVLAKTGEWYVEDGAARMIENYLSRDYIRTGKFGPVGRGLLALKNATTAIELGLSPFHAVFESNEVMGSSIGLGISKLASGKLSGIKDILGAPFSPKTTSAIGKAGIQFAKNPTEFRRIYPDAYKWFTDKYPEAGRLIDDLFKGGGQPGMNEDYRVRGVQGFKKAVAEGNYPGAIIRSFPALNELAMKPLFQTYIPRLKVGMFLREYSFELERNSDKLAAGTLTRPELARKTWAFIEDRFGELNFDNLYWDRTFKSAMQLMFRSVTWKLGNLRGFGKAHRDIWTEALKPLMKGEKPRITLPVAWLAGMAMVTAVQSSIISKVSTGKYPWELAKDGVDQIRNLVFPRIDPDDERQRVSVPTYWRDMVHLAHSPSGYVGSSMTGEWRRIYDDLVNRDFYRHPIYNPNDPIQKKVAASLGHLIPLPFGASSAIAATQEGVGPARASAGFLGFTKAPSYVSPSSASQIRDLAMKWKTDSKIPKLVNEARRQTTEQFEPSDYQPLKAALKNRNYSAARNALDKLLEEGHTTRNIAQSMRPLNQEGKPRPFTGSQLQEKYFLKSLTPEQRELYNESVRDRIETYRRFREMLKQPATNN